MDFKTNATLRMRVAPYAFNPGFDNAQLILHECSDRLLLPQPYFEDEHIQIDDLLILTNKHNQSICGTVCGIHTHDSSVIYAPSWMIHYLDVLEPIKIAHLNKIIPICLAIRPHSEQFLKDPNFIKILNQAISNYKSLTKNTRISLLINGQIEYLTIEDMLPSNLSTCFVYNCGKVDIKILSPKHPPPPKNELAYLYKSPQKPDYKFSFVGLGHTLGGGVEPLLIPQQAAATAARRRMELISKGFRPY